MAPLAAAVAHRERIRLLPFTFDAALQVLVVGSGASLGREVAPRQFAVALGNLATGWMKRLSARDRQILLACAAGAGLGAVYAVPLGGALFTLRIMLKTWHPRAVGAALITSSLAVSVCLVRHPRSAEPGLAQPARVLPADRATRWRWPRWRCDWGWRSTD